MTCSGVGTTRGSTIFASWTPAAGCKPRNHGQIPFFVLPEVAPKLSAVAPTCSNSRVDFLEFKDSCKQPVPVYFLKTSQDYLKKKVFEHARQQVDESARDFDWSVFDLEKDSELDVVNDARTLPWMSKFRWIYVRSAGAAKAELLELLKDPPSRTVMVLEVEKSPPKTLRHPVVAMPEHVDLSAWIQKRVGEDELKIGRDALRALIELVGDDLLRLDSELEKLALFCRQTGKITREDVLQMAIPAQRHDIFELVGALASRRCELALSILNRLFEGGMSAPQIVATLAWSFRRLLVARELLERRKPFYGIVKDLKIWSYRDREKEIRATSKRRFAELLIRLRDVDRLCKTTSGDEKTMLERLVVDTCVGPSV